MAQDDDSIGWVSFPDGAASLRRLVLPDDGRGLYLRTAATEAGREVLRRALAMDFKELKTPGALRMILPEGQAPFGPKKLARILGGTPIRIPREDFLSSKWTIDIAARMEQRRGAQGDAPDPDKVQHIGMNRLGEDVVRDGDRRFRRVTDTQGRATFTPEAGGGHPTLYLRATRPEDLEQIANGLVFMARHGTLQADDYARVLDAAIETAPEGMSRATSDEALRRHMLREITSTSLEDNASRDRFSRALHLGDAASAAFPVSREQTGEMSISPAFAIFLRRTMRDNREVDLRGGETLRALAPRRTSENASLQALDLSGVPASGVSGFLANALSRRPADGRSLLILPHQGDEAGQELIEVARDAVGRHYALEVVANIAAPAACGDASGPAAGFISVGERRPEPLDALPLAALRSFDVLTGNDFIAMEREIMRSATRIRDFHAGTDDAPRAEDNREDNVRQRPYRPLSQIQPPFTMIPLALEGASAHALQRVRRDTHERGGVDSCVAGLLGESLDGLKEIVHSEQVDAVSMRQTAAERGRAFLLSDATGVGKGRALAAMARAHLRSSSDARVIYFTESAEINAPDVFRDLQAVRATDGSDLMFMTAKTVAQATRTDPATGLPYSVELTSPKPARRREIMESGQWPEEARIMVTTYSAFRGNAEAPSTAWLSDALDENVMIILDEAHNALNENSIQGRNIRAAITAVGRSENIVYATATPLRDPKGANLYKPLMPHVGNNEITRLLDDIKSGGEVAQEAFATMLASDGVMLRRDHDLSNIEFRISLPPDDMILRYQDVMDRFSPVVEMMVDASLQISGYNNSRQAADYDRRIARGASPEDAKAHSNAMNQYSVALGSPLSMLSRIMINALQIDQTVDAALAEMEEGRKPLITFHSTNAGLLDELSKGPDGKRSEEAMAAAEDLNLRDQIMRVHDTIYRITREGVRQDARDIFPDIAETSERIKEAISEIPADLPVSPVDALIERLEAHGVSVGEVSGRVMAYRGNRIEFRKNRDKRATVDAFNSGEHDVMIYNSAGATGGSYHASRDFADQRPRTMIEMEAPTDIIKYIQGMGRGNRYGQVARPRVVSIATGLIPEMRILQQRNRKLRALGASVDGNRSHPLLLDDVPDLINRVGDEATRNVLQGMPGTARRLGFPEFAEITEADLTAQNAVNGELDTGSGAGVGSGAESLSNKVLTRSIMLRAQEQSEIVERIKMEFDTLIEELESRNANPLRPKELDGRIEIRATSIFSGREIDEGDMDTSSFLSPLYIHTAVHHYDEEAWSGDRLVSEIEKVRRLYGSEGFAPWADRINQNIHAIMQPYATEAVPVEQAIADPGRANASFRNRYEKITDLAWLLENIRPGVHIRYPDILEEGGAANRTVVGLTPPPHGAMFDMVSAYKMNLISPGMSKPETVSLGRLMVTGIDRIIFRPGVSESFREDYLAGFDEDRMMKRRLPTQILTGNILMAISEAEQNRLGTISLYRDLEGQVHRGIVVPKSKVDLEKLPVSLNSGALASEMGYRIMTGRIQGNYASVRLWASMDPGADPGNRAEADIICRIGQRKFNMDPMPLRKSTEAFYRDRPGLYEAMYEKPMPQPDDVKERAYRHTKKKPHEVTFDITTEEGRLRAMSILRRLDGLPMMMDGDMRASLNEAAVDLDRMTGMAGDQVEDAEIVEERGPDGAAEDGPREDPGDEPPEEGPDDDMMNDIAWER